MTLIRRIKYCFKRTAKYTCFILILGFCFSSCKKENGASFWDLDVLTPLLKSTLTINNIIQDTLLHQQVDNSLELVYTNKLYTFSVDSLFQIPNIGIDTVFWLPLVVTTGPGNSIIPTVTDENQNNFSGVQLTSVLLRAGQMKIVVRSQVQSMIDYTYKIISATDKFGNPFDTTLRIPAATLTSDGIVTAVFDLSGYKINLTGKNGNKVNTIITYYSAEISPIPYGNNVTINPGDSVFISNQFTNIIPEYGKGYFGNLVSAIGPESATFSLFNHILGGKLDLEKIDVNLSIENSVGADGRFTIHNLSSVNTRTGTSIPLSHSIIGSQINLNRASENAGKVTPSLYKASITPANSNIKQFVENFPDHLNYQMDFEINPLGNVSGGNDFIYYDKLLKAEMNITIPLSLLANDLALSDTLDFKMDKTTSNVNSGTLFIYAQNGFPFTAQAQLYLLNDNLEVMDSLISFSNTILAPILDSNFICEGKKETKLSVPISETQFNKLRLAKKIIVKMKFNTVDQPRYVKVYGFYAMDIKVVGDFSYAVRK